MTHNNVTPLHRDIAPVDYPIIGARFVHPQTYTGSEVTFAFLLGGFVGCLLTVGLAFVWSFFL